MCTNACSQPEVERSPNPKGPKIEKNQSRLIHSRLKFSISLENFKVRIEYFNPDLQKSPRKNGVW